MEKFIRSVLLNETCTLSRKPNRMKAIYFLTVITHTDNNKNRKNTAKEDNENWNMKIIKYRITEDHLLTHLSLPIISKTDVEVFLQLLECFSSSDLAQSMQYPVFLPSWRVRSLNIQKHRLSTTSQNISQNHTLNTVRVKVYLNLLQLYTLSQLQETARIPTIPCS